MCLTKDEKEIISVLQTRNDSQYNALKLAEELNELAVELMQFYTKPTKDNLVAMTEELGDVKLRLAIFISPIIKESVNSRVSMKLAKYKRYLEEKNYTNI